ncbi:uncharacterized protein TRAVEDRAFT_61340 [Trametes versicolor FP-101664 SS1]|uniref:uncharacterized protein n=1 Tax=Trametes versicolor (strain FP-101664) TaxID=717944 RepID=UPI000462161C|nr:uncharacterized protein TRAVEDRAFT_61340 [Trametes versicolor FP-101664 SS1]EIW52401.1 hypothetical protein TRAVEDRAFT_61340 [Trametes versicolor FP-101664 SS1]
MDSLGDPSQCPVLPVEVFEEIIDAVGGFWRPQHTLKNCALTCRAWLPRSQLNLFRCIIVAPTGAEQLYRLAHVLDVSPHLREFVHEIKVSMSKRQAGKQLTGREAFEVLPILLSGKVPALRALRVSAINKNASALILYPSFFATLPQLKSITTLELYHVTFARFGELARMLSILANLRDLKCGYVRWQSAGVYRFPPGYYGSCSISHFRWEGPKPSSNGASILAPGTDALLTAARLSIVDLSVDAHEFGPRSGHSLSSFPALRVLRLNWRLGLDDSPEENAEIAAALANSGSATLRHFTLRISIPRDPIVSSSKTHDHIQAIGHGLDSSLSSASFPALQAIVIHGGHDPWLFEPQWWWSELAAAFPRAYKKQMLHLCGTRQDLNYRRFVPQEVELTVDGRQVPL